MIHASVELVDAMSGVVGSDRSGSRRDGAFATLACSPSAAHNGTVAWGWGALCDPSRLVVDCPNCLRLMRDAIVAADPVRWDALESRGLAKL